MDAVAPNTLETDLKDRLNRVVEEYFSIHPDLTPEPESDVDRRHWEMDMSVCLRSVKALYYVLDGHADSQMQLAERAGLDPRERARMRLTAKEYKRRTGNLGAKVATILEERGLITRGPEDGNAPRPIDITPLGERWAEGEITFSADDWSDPDWMPTGDGEEKS